MKNNWEPKQIRVRDLERKIGNNEIAVPTYQRGIVWSQKMQKDLIDSIKRGYPFGTLVMFNYEDNDKPLLLIDGLQRSTALFNFINNPSSFFEESDIEDDTIESLCEILGWNDVSASQMRVMKEKIVAWTKDLKTSNEVRNMDTYDCAYMLAKEFMLPGNNPNDHEFVKKIKEVIDPVFNNFKQLCSTVEDKQVPYLEITGDDSELSEIFFRINDRGTKLTKENKFAATWATHFITITNERLYPLVDLVAARYDHIQQQGTSIYGYDHQKFISERKLDVFELSYAFGKYIKQQYGYLFGKAKDIVAAEAIGFTLLNSCLMGTKETLPKMNVKLLETFETAEEINSFIIKILSCIQYVDRILAPVLKFKSNKRLGKAPLHTDFQICSIIASIFRLKHIGIDEIGYQFNLTEVSSKWYTYDILLRKNLIKKYLSDSLNNTWSGHGDNTLDNIIHNDPELYTRDISYINLKSTMYNWYSMYKNQHREYLEKDIASPSSCDKLILNLIYSNKFSAEMQLNEDKFDIEHILPKKLAEDLLKRFNGELKLTLSSIGNLCLLPEYTNRKKKDKTIYNDQEYINKLGARITLEDLEKNYTFTTVEDLSWLDDPNISKEDIEAEYNQFIDKRFETMVEMILNKLYSSD